jgi:hypothetical protein
MSAMRLSVLGDQIQAAGSAVMDTLLPPDSAHKCGRPRLRPDHRRCSLDWVHPSREMTTWLQLEYRSWSASPVIAQRRTADLERFPLVAEAVPVQIIGDFAIVVFSEELCDGAAEVPQEAVGRCGTVDDDSG